MTPPVIHELIDRFQRNERAYRAPQYNEAQTRQELIDPVFEALGWDMHNRLGKAEAYKDVVHEDAIKIGGATKAPDYSFRIGGRRIFFLEAKKPAVHVRDDAVPAFQLRRYAWSSKLPLSIVTNFAELAVYDCRVKPVHTDKASAARVLYLRYDEYASRWDEFAGIFSRESVERGSFDRFAAASRLKRGTAEVDQAFLGEIESWRDVLARNFALRNEALSERELNFAVERTIDRIIFLRMCEDRGIEDYGQLAAIANGEGTYRRLCEVFQRADERYNSGLFHFDVEKGRNEPPDELTPGLILDDKPLKGILRGLYYPESPYEFSVLPAEILGEVYEQFLGKVISLSKGHRATVTEKPEVRKAGGVYYTPAYIVDYIVRETLGKLLEEKSPRQAAKLRVLDPACGSGSFLVGAYAYLLDWHRDRYVEDGPERHGKEIYRGGGGSWHLTTAEKKRILLNNIYGVDIDTQAVEVTKLSLMLKVLEGENRESLERQRRFLHERALPDLAGNIKCGNSLIGPDYYNGRQITFLDDEERYRVNAFDWRAEFPDIFRGKHGGFDCAIGNPPWGQKEIAADATVKDYIRAHFPSTVGIYDLFRPFVERGIRLLAPDGLFGMVLPDIVLLKDYAATRSFVLDQMTLLRIDWWGMAFRAAVIDAATVVGQRREATDDQLVRVCVRDPTAWLEHSIPQRDFRANPRQTFNLHLTPDKRRVLESLAAHPRLGDCFEIHEGVHSGNIRARLFVDSPLDDSCRELLFGRDEIAPYRLAWNGRFVRLGAVPARRGGRAYANAGQPRWFEREKLLVRRTGDHVLAAVERNGRYASNNFFVVFPRHGAVTLPDLDALCALLNSRFMTWYFRAIEPRQGRVFAELKIKHLRDFPLPLPNQNALAGNELSKLGAARSLWADKLATARTPHAREVAERTAETLDREIDALVCGLLNVDASILHEECMRHVETANNDESSSGKPTRKRQGAMPHRGAPRLGDGRPSTAASVSFGSSE